MIGSLRGTLIERGATGVIIEVAGVGYRLAVTPATSAHLGAEGDEVFVWVHHHIRDDAQTLFGFTSRESRDAFEVLIATHGVGPSLGLAILAVHEPAALRFAVASDDIAALCLVPGVGRKTAARLLIELKSRFDLEAIDLSEFNTTDISTAAAPPRSPRGDVREALGALGYGAEEIARIVQRIPAEGDSAELLRAALLQLATG